MEFNRDGRAGLCGGGWSPRCFPVIDGVSPPRHYPPPRTPGITKGQVLRQSGCGTLFRYRTSIDSSHRNGITDLRFGKKSVRNCGKNRTLEISRRQAEIHRNHTVSGGAVNLHSIKRIVVLFWALFFTIVFATNLCDAFREIGMLPKDWAFASGNFGFVKQAVVIFSLPDGFTWTLYGLIILLELTIAFLFWKTWRNGDALRSSDGRSAATAFGAAIILWSVFLLSDEFFIVYDRLSGAEEGHFTGLIAQVVTFGLVLFGAERPEGREP